MMRGALTDLAGDPMAGAQVLLAAWPSNEAVRALPVGGEFTLTPLARTVTGANGSFALREVVTPLLSALTGKQVDIELDVLHRGRHYVHLTQLTADRAKGWLRTAVHGVDGQQMTEGPGANILDLVLDPQQATPLGRARVPSSVALPSGDPKPYPGTCLRYQKFEPKRAMTTVATAVARNGPRISTTYTGEATTVNSTGFSFDSGVSFAVNGARERTSTFTAGFLERTAKRGQVIGREYRVEWQHNVLRRECLFHGVSSAQYATSPDFATGGYDDVRSRYPEWTCVLNHTVRGHGEYMSTENKKAATYESAFGFSPIGGTGFTGSAQSGYSEAVKVEFLPKRPQRAFWCGDSGTPTQNGQRVQGFER